MACPATLLQVINSIEPVTPGRQSTLGGTLGLTQYTFPLEHRGGVRSQLRPKLEEGLPFPFRWILGQEHDDQGQSCSVYLCLGHSDLKRTRVLRSVLLHPSEPSC